MKLFEVKCPNCNASLSVKSNRKNMVCEYCQAKFLLDDEAVIVKHINAGEISEEQEFINAETNLNVLKDYDEAYECYYSLSKRYVDNKELWLGLLRSYTDDFTNDDVEVSEYTKYWKKYKALADEAEINDYENKFREYDEKIREKFNVFAANEIENNSFNVETEAHSVDSGSKETMSPLAELIITILLGPLGVHKFMKGKIGMGILYLFTFGLFYIGWIIDITKAARKLKNG